MSGGFFYNLGAFQVELDRLSVPEYVYVLRKSEKCPYGPSAHIYHEYFERLPSFAEPHGKKGRIPCVEVAVGIAFVRGYKSRVTEGKEKP